MWVHRGKGKIAIMLLLAFAAMMARGEDARPCFDAIYALKHDELKEAISLYTRCIEDGDLTTRNLIVAYNDRGNAWGKLGEYSKALSDFNRVIELNPEDPDAWYNRGLTHKRLGHSDAALRDYSRAIELNDAYIKAYNNRGILYGMHGDYRAAIADFDSAIARAPDNAGAWFNRGLAHYSLGEYRQAVTDLERAIELDETYLKAYENLAWLRATCPDKTLRDGQQALHLARKARFLAPRGTYTLYDVLAAAHASSGSLDDAIRYQQLAIDTAPDGAKGTLQRRLEIYRQGDAFQDDGGNRFL